MSKCLQKAELPCPNTQPPDERIFMAKKTSPSERPIKNGLHSVDANTPNGSSSEILDILGRVANALKNENASLDGIGSETNELARSLKDTAAQAASVANSSEETASSAN